MCVCLVRRGKGGVSCRAAAFQIRIAVMVREELLRGERRVRKAAEMSMAGKLLLRDELSKAVQEAENAGEKRLSPQVNAQKKDLEDWGF